MGTKKVTSLPHQPLGSPALVEVLLQSVSAVMVAQVLDERFQRLGFPDVSDTAVGEVDQDRLAMIENLKVLDAVCIQPGIMPLY
jgi:hypothetical protein